MPFDMGVVTPFPTRRKQAAPAPADLLSQPRQTAGAVLRAAREAQGLTLPQLAETTRVRRAYLQAIEDMRPDLLPSRPFAVGYAKAYARALGLDAEDVAERFKTELPGAAESPGLRAPVGVANEDHGSRWPVLAGGAVALLGVILLWNVAQRAVTFEQPAPPPAPEAPQAWLRTPPPSGPVPLEPPAPAPAEQTIPAPYLTPGLEEFAALQAGGDPLAVPPPAAGATLPPVVLNAAQGSRTQHFGQGAFPQTVLLKARRSAALVVRRPDGQVLFARLMKPGDSWRQPPVPGLIVEVAEPSAWDVYAYGRFKGQLTGLTATLPQLAS